MEEEQLKKVNAFVAENKGKRKFTQSVELAINFRGIDFTKNENRLNLTLILPKGKGKEIKVGVFTDDASLGEKAKALGARVIGSKELQELAADSAKQNQLLDYELVAQPNLMPQVARALGQFLGPRNKMPKPIAGTDISSMVGNLSKSTYLRSKGKYLPTVHCVIGTEAMPVEDIAANIDTVINEVVKKVGKQNLRSVYMKFTMSKPVKLV